VGENDRSEIIPFIAVPRQLEYCRPATPAQGETRLAQVVLVRRPRRWDAPFARERLSPDLVACVLSLPVLQEIDPAGFPADLALEDIVANDTRIRQFSRDEVIYSQGSYGTSLFLVLDGSVREVTAARRQKGGRKIWNKPGPPECGALHFSGNDIFGEFEALTRSPRQHTTVSDSADTVLLEIRWPGVRDLRHWSDDFQRRIDTLYRLRGRHNGLRQCAAFNHCDDETLAAIAEQCSFESWGSFDWTHGYQRTLTSDGGPETISAHEPVITAEGDHLDDLLVIRAGSARVSEKLGRGERTLGFLSPGDVFGAHEIAATLQTGESPRAKYNLRAIGYTDVIQIPVGIAGQFMRLAPEQTRAPAHKQSLLDFALDRRFTNGTQAMAIDTTRCVNCDECVRACAATHNNIPRFVRHGPAHDNLMVANACMHCVDPVCLVDCPTDAIHRDVKTGNVVIDEATCIGCASCAGACPYGNIEMREVRNSDGGFHIDQDGSYVLRATKCDLCTGRNGGPACQQACPHDALIRIDFQDIGGLSDWLDRQ